MVKICHGIFYQCKLAADTVIAVWKSETNSNPKLKKSWQGEMTNVTKAGFQAVLSAPFYMNYISYGTNFEKTKERT